jgi:hypothetical protein
MPYLVWIQLPSPEPEIMRMLLGSLSRLLSFPSDADEISNHVQLRAQEWVKTAEGSIRALADKRLNQYRLLESADILGIPVFKILPDIDALGSGQYIRWFNSTITDKTSSLAGC